MPVILVGGGEENTVSMKSGLGDRNNFHETRLAHLRRSVSMKSGLGDRNNAVTIDKQPERHFRLNEVRSWRPEQCGTVWYSNVGGVTASQ